MDDTLQLVRRTLQADASAWTSLQALLEPLLVRIIRRHQAMRRKGLAEQADDIAEVRTAALERLAAHDFQNLRAFMTRSAAASESRSLESWIYGVVDYAIRDHLRQRFGRAPKQAAAHAVQPSKRDLHTLAGRLDDGAELGLHSAMGVTERLSLAELRAYMAEAFSSDEIKAMQLYYGEGLGHEELASALALPDAKQAEQLIRRLNGRLRYRFAPER